MKMKKVLSLALSGVLAVSMLAGCESGFGSIKNHSADAAEAFTDSYNSAAYKAPNFTFTHLDAKVNSAAYGLTVEDLNKDLLDLNDDEKAKKLVDLTKSRLPAKGGYIVYGDTSIDYDTLISLFGDDPDTIVLTFVVPDAGYLGDQKLDDAFFSALAESTLSEAELIGDAADDISKFFGMTSITIDENNKYDLSWKANIALYEKTVDKKDACIMLCSLEMTATKVDA